MARDPSAEELRRAHARVRRFAAEFDAELLQTPIGARMCPESNLLQLHLEYLNADQAFFYFSFRTTSWDFGGERTDLHDVVPLAVAALLSCTGHASCQLIDEVNPGIPGPYDEIYARLLVPRQPNAIADLANIDAFRTTVGIAWELEALIWRSLHEEEDCPCREDSGRPLLEADPEWSRSVLRALRRRSSPRLFVSRRAWPAWEYLHIPRNATTVVASPGLAKLLAWLDTTTPRRGLTTEEGRFVRVRELKHLIPPATLTRAEQILHRLDDLDWDNDSQVHLFPLEDRVVAVGQNHVLSLPAESGVGAFRSGLARAQERRREEASFFRADAQFAWARSIPPGRFEELVAALLTSSGNAAWLRRLGTTNERDRGRDLIAEWIAPTPADTIPQGASPRVRVPVVVQCKAYARPVNASDVPGIVDTVEEHGADGYFLAVASRISAPLADRLESFRRRGRFSVVDWWTRAEIETELRRAPEVLTRFTDVVRER